jgi:hypothetical protein
MLHASLIKFKESKHEQNTLVYIKVREKKNKYRIKIAVRDSSLEQQKLGKCKRCFGDHKRSLCLRTFLLTVTKLSL